MEAHQSPEGLALLITIASLCAIILATAFSLTFIFKRDTSDNQAHH